MKKALRYKLSNKKVHIFVPITNGGEIGIRTLGTRKGTLVFKTSSLNQLGHLST